MAKAPDTSPEFLAPISREIWARKYRFSGSASDAAEQSLADTFLRVARAAASVEKGGKRQQEKWTRTFYEAFADFGFLPAGRILAGAGSGRNVTLFNCFVLGTIEDDLGSIFEQVKEAALTMQAGGGIGHDFSTLRPKGALVRSIGADASGPVSFMDVWDAMCRTIMSAGQRRGAMMATLRCDHPDIEDFIAVKHDAKRLRNFNLSVLVTDGFMTAVKDGKPWNLEFAGKVYKTVSARELWDKLMRATYDYAEPGVIFIDRVNAMNNLAYCETISATNPCGEQPLPPYGACLLGSINLAALVERPFEPGAAIDSVKLEARVATAVRLLDNVIDISRYPLKAQANEARAKRRIGLGVTGLADALIFSGLHYGTEAARTQARQWMATIQNAAYRTSALLAEEKGAFPLFDQKAFLRRPNAERLGADVRRAIAGRGIRNGCLTSIAPTGTISLLAGNVSSGVEPVFDFSYTRRVLQEGGEAAEERVEDYAYRRYRELHPGSGKANGPHGEEAALPAVFVRAGELAPADHLAMQAALQPFVDSAISKTINCPEAMSFADFRNVYRDAYDLGLKGCTTYRPNPVTGAVLVAADQGAGAAPPSAALLQPSFAQASETDLGLAAAVSSRDPALRLAAQQGGGRESGIVYLSKPLERDAALEGVTYKIKWPASPHALYVTINDIVRDGRRRPFEIFINTKNLEHFAWTVALTRMISAVFRRGGDVSFVAEELKAVFDPEGGRWMDGRYVPSLLAAIGEVIEAHMLRIGFLIPEEGAGAGGENQKKLAAAVPSNLEDMTEPEEERGAAPGRLSADRNGRDRGAAARGAAPLGPEATARYCPRCGNRSLHRIEGCWTCANCHYSRCG